MSISEILTSNVDKIVPRPSSAWVEYIQSIRNGNEESVLVYNYGDKIIFDYYGTNPKKNVKQGRVRIPLNNNKFELSYHITETPDGIFHSINEGIFPYAD